MDGVVKIGEGEEGKVGFQTLLLSFQIAAAAS